MKVLIIKNYFMTRVIDEKKGRKAQEIVDQRSEVGAAEAAGPGHEAWGGGQTLLGLTFFRLFSSSSS